VGRGFAKTCDNRKTSEAWCCQKAECSNKALLYLLLPKTKGRPAKPRKNVIAIGYIHPAKIGYD
jgi:hypothetical protein